MDIDVKKMLIWLSNDKAGTPFDEKNYFASRDIFQASLDNLFKETNNPLLVAVCGEIGNNSFDHNLGKWRDLPGLHFERKAGFVIFADRGQGVRATLSKVVPGINSDVEAVEIAFTKIISGRSPEQRGNGLKFVKKVVIDNNWNLFFQSGDGVVRINSGKVEFKVASQKVNGCLVVIGYK